MTFSGGSGGPLTDRTGVSYSNGTRSSTYHIYANGLDWSKSVGVLVYGDGSGEYGLVNPADTYLLAGGTGLIAVAKSHNMILVTPRAPGNGCTDGDGVCWYLPSNDGTTRAQKTKWLDDLIKTQVLAKYDIDKTRVCLAGFSSGAENVAGIYGPAYAASWMEDGLLLAISYGSSPDQYGVTDTYTADFRARVAVVWDVRGGDETSALADSQEGRDWYVAEGFVTTVRTVVAGGQHDRPGEFGTIVHQYVTAHVPAASTRGGGAPSTARTNLCPNPALTSVSTGWSGLGGGRATDGSSSLPRQTVWEVGGSPSGTLVTPRFAAVAGLPYVGSIWVRSFGADSSVTLGIRWYDSDGSLISTSTTAITLASATGTRYEIGPVAAPAGAVQGALIVGGVSVTGEWTAVLVEQTSSTGGSYFDGNSAGAAWTGAAGNSPSALGGAAGTDAWSWSDTASVSTAAPGPVGTDSWAGGWQDSAGTVVAVPSEPIIDAWAWRDAGAIVTSAYDERYGRIRLSAFGLPDSAVRVVVESRPAAASVWTRVRGGKIAVVGGAMVRPLDDYEFVAGSAMTYRITALASVESAADVVVAQVTVTRAADPAGAWLKFLTAPWLNRRVVVSDFTPLQRKARTSLYEVEGRAAPVAVSDVHSGRTTTLTLECATAADRDALDDALCRGLPLFVHTPLAHPLPSLYAVVGDYEISRPRGAKITRAARAGRARFTVPIVEVDPPPPSVVGAVRTWAQILEQYATWQDVLDAYPTWADLL